MPSERARVRVCDDGIVELLDQSGKPCACMSAGTYEGLRKKLSEVRPPAWPSLEEMGTRAS